MPFSYLVPKRNLALKLAQLKGTSQATLEAALVGSWVTALDGAEIPITAFRDSILYIAKEIAQVIASSPSHPMRSFLYCRTAVLTDNDSIPVVDNNNVEVIGVWDSCAEEDTNIPLTWQPTQIISDSLDPFFDDADLREYNITGNNIRGTRPEFYLQGCSWDNDAQIALYEADGDCPLPEACEALLIDGVMERSAQVGWTDAAQVMPYYSNLYRQGLADLARMGQASMPLASTNPVGG